MSKKTIAMLLVIALVGASLGMAGGAKEGAEAKPIYLKLGLESNKESAQYKAMVAYKEYAEKKSNGRIKVDVFDSGQLGVDKEAVSMIKMGTVQGWDINTSLLSAIEPSFMIFDLPYMTTSQEELVKILEKNFGKFLSDKLVAKTEIMVASWFVRGPRNVYGNKGPINSPKDMAGMKIRVMQNPIMVKTMELLGAKPVPLAASERYMALQTGVVDAAEGVFSLVINQKEYEVAKFMSMTGHFNTPNCLIMDYRIYKNAAAELKQIMDEAAKECQRVSIETDKAMNDAGRKILEEKGMKINDIADLTPFETLVKPLHDEYGPKIGKDVMDRFFALRKEVRGK